MKFSLPTQVTQTVTDKNPHVGTIKPPISTGITNIGISNERKFIIASSFSTNGTIGNRAKFDYGTFWGGSGGDIPDTFRDIGGNYWTKKGNGVEFLSKAAKDRDKTEEARIPFVVKYKKPKTIPGLIWSEYTQDIYITPDPDWLYGTFAQGVFNVSKDEIKTNFGAMSNSEILAMTNYTLEQHGVQGSGFTLQQSVDFYIEKVLETKSEQIVMLLQEWWKSKLNINSTLVGSDLEKGPCAQLLNFAQLSANDPSISDTFGPQEICSPWIKTNTTYVDHVVDSFQPVETGQNEELQLNLAIKTPFFSANSEYNFYLREYEEVITSGDISEKLYPNMYVFVASFASEKVTGEKSDFLRYERIINLDGIVSEFSAKELKINDKDILENNNLKKPPASSKQYFSYWSNNLKKELKKNPQKVSALANTVGKNQNLIFFPMQDTDILKNYNDQKFMFPMYNEIEFNTGVTNIIGDTLRQTALSNHFMRYYCINNNTLFKENFTGDSEKSVLRELTPFVKVDTKKSYAKINGDKKVFTEQEVEQDQISTTNMTAFLATIDFGNFVKDKGAGAISNFGMTQEQIDYVKNTFNDSDLINSFSQNSIFVAKDENEEFLVSSPDNEMQRVLMSAILYGKLKKIESERHRSFYDMMRGKSNYSETIMYHIVKRRVNETGQPQTKLQDYYFLNSSEIDVLKFIDTQVSYGVQYQYDIRAVVLSFGMSYEYTSPKLISEVTFDQTDYSQVEEYSEKDENLPEGPPQESAGGSTSTDPAFANAFNPEGSQANQAAGSTEVEDTGEGLVLTQELFDSQKAFDSIFEGVDLNSTVSSIGGNFMTAKVKVRYRPDYKLLQVPFASTRSRVLDKPPIFPDALLTPYKGHNNKLLINLNQNVGEYFMKPIMIDPDELEQYLKLADSQKIKPTLGDSQPAIEYKSDDPLGDGGYFEVYRTDKKPSTYFDFADNLLTTIDGFHDTAVGHVNTDSASLVDNIKPNRKYYYMFRVVDVHGNVSNPSAVFEIEMIDDGGTVYMIQNIVELEEPNLKEVSKSFKKYLQIKPVFHQTLMNVPKSTSPLPSAFDYGPFGSEGDIKLGTADTALWGKRFKIRITSKSSGKQIDLNVKFTRTDDTSSVENAEGTLFSKPRP
jgi:hypothetical protein